MTLAVWVGCCARRRKAPRRCRRESSCDLAREEHDAQDAPPRMCAALCSVAGGVGRGPTAGGRARAHNAERDSLVQLARPALVQLGGRARACGVGSRCRARGSSLSARDACRVGWVLCTPQTIRSATTARELWRSRSRRTGRSQGSTSKVRGCVLGGWEGRDLVERGSRLCSWAARRARARAASGPLAGRVAPPYRRDACRVGWMLCTSQGIASVSKT